MKSIKIGSRIIGPHVKPFIVLEAGVNHNGDLSLAKEMIRVAKKSGADAIKFQTFKADEFVGNPDQMYTYHSQSKVVTQSMLEMFRSYEFSRDEWFEVKNTCDQEEITFFSTPQNVSDLELLIELGVPVVKVGSDDFTNLSLLRSYSESGLPIFISCGMADLAEVYQSLI